MAGGRDWEDDDEILADDRDDPQEADLDAEDDETDTVLCPNCRREVAESTQRCPYCGDWIVPGAGPEPPTGRRVFVLVAAVLVIVIVLAWSMGR